MREIYDWAGEREGRELRKAQLINYLILGIGIGAFLATGSGLLGFLW